jgi:hypothetical protein
MQSTKICNCCKQEFPATKKYFHKCSVVKSGLNGTCKVCACARVMSNWYKYNKDKNKIEYENIKRRCIEYKGGKCSICGYNKCTAAFDFHHINEEDKKFNIATGISSKKSWKKLAAEMDKCLLLCSNCHREFHYNARES